MSTRLWTWGYDIFSPSQSVVGHIYVRRHKPKFWESVRCRFLGIHMGLYHISFFIAAKQNLTPTPPPPPVMIICISAFISSIGSSSILSRGSQPTAGNGFGSNQVPVGISRSCQRYDQLEESTHCSRTIHHGYRATLVSIFGNSRP